MRLDNKEGFMIIEPTENVQTAQIYIPAKPNDIVFRINGKERLRITEDGKFIVDSIVKVDTAVEADKIYHALMDIFVRGK